MTRHARRCNSRAEKAAEDPAKDPSAPQEYDCTPSYHGREYSFSGESAPSGGWRAVYAAMEVPHP